MGRIRTIKPELFLDEALGAMSGDHVLLFVGLFTVADREGRLPWRPARLKATLFPYRPVDVAALGADLDAADKVQIYEVAGESYLWIPGFTRHQRPHPKEPASVLPEAPRRERSRRSVERSACIPSSPVGREGKEILEGKGKEDSPSENTRAALADDFALEEQRPTRTRKPSRQQMLYTALVAHRAEVLGPDALPDEPWTVQRQNEALGGPILDCEPGLLLAALQRFLESDFAGRCNPPGPLGVFVKQWSRWVSDVMRSNAGGVK